ncbi:hypothetical protein [Pseudomonas phage U1B]|nr:hypothetical protein [Pseudomonas phage T2P]QYV99225.1 hypothetical protein [Pseudomonas phage U1B]QYV99681.1 hypothetical protein [Pseudomonas phage U5]
MTAFAQPNPFLKDVNDYHRDIDIINACLDDNAKYLQLMTKDELNISLEECKEFVKEQLRQNGEYALRNPVATILDKNKFGDRELKTVSFMAFLNRVKKQNLLLSPSMTAYLPESVRQSTHSIYIAEGVKNRKRVKGEQMQAEREAAAFLQAGDKENSQIKTELAQVRKGEQENFKINNNSYSGGTVSAATILYYKSTHSSLTSTCRTGTSYANSNNEKFIMGNRHYYTPEITKANLVNIINVADMELIQKAVTNFNLYCPTPEEVVDMVLYSTKHYWQNKYYTAQILKLATGMTPVERAAVMYVGDLYHLYKYNKELIKSFLIKLSQVGTKEQIITEEEYSTYDGDMDLLASFICFDTVKGRSKAKLKESDPDTLNQIFATGRNIAETLNEYRLLIEAFFLTNCVPSSIHAFPTVYRRAAVISDTDSTMFTLQWWVEEFFGKVTFSNEAKRLVFALVFLVSEVVMHILAIQSANMGVAKDKLRLFAMKNEYYFAVLALTTRSKHYFASQDAQEGVMFNESRMEIKGVGLRDSKVPKKINSRAKKLMEDIIKTVKAEEKIDLASILKEAGDIEREIIESVRSGKAEYLTSGQTKRPESYKSEDNSTHKKGLVWKTVFAPSFGEAGDPPYSHVKISVTLNNKTAIKEWIDGIEDKKLAARIQAWVTEENKTSIGDFHIPSTVVETGRIPEVITRVADVRTIIGNTMGVFYLTLESLGIFLIDKNNDRLISDFY